MVFSRKPSESLWSSRGLLQLEATNLKSEKERRDKERQQSGSNVAKESAPSISTAGGILLVPIAKYAWDQSEKFVSIYVDFPGVGSFSGECVSSDFVEHGFKVSVKPPSAGSVHQIAVSNLNQSTTPEKCKVVVKADRFVIKLKKSEVGLEWDALDDSDRKRKEARDKRVQHGDLKGASTMQLIQDMYENADEEGKRSLAEAMAKGEKKRADDAKMR